MSVYEPSVYPREWADFDGDDGREEKPLYGLGERGPRGTEPGRVMDVSDSKLATRFPTRRPVGGAGLNVRSGVAARAVDDAGTDGGGERADEVGEP